MRYFIIALCIFCASCGGSLSDEQRKRMREQMEQHEIKKITDAEITEAALQWGRQVCNTLVSFKNDSVRIDSMLHANPKIRWVVPGDRSALRVELELLEAYMETDLQQVNDNIQELRTAEGKSDSLLYTRPVVAALPNDTARLVGVWNVWISKKELILSMDKQ